MSETTEIETEYSPETPELAASRETADLTCLLLSCEPTQD